MQKTCENCGATFPCQPEGCWCFDVELSNDQSAKLKENFEDCLCEKCLTYLLPSK